MNGAKADDRRGDPGSLRSFEFGLLQVDVMDHLRERIDSRLVQGEPFHENLERAEIALVRELRLEHVEAKLTGFGHVTLRRNELERRFRIDEPLHEPRARD